MKLLVCGANGQVGQALTALGGNADLNVIGLDRKELDIGNRDQIENCLNHYKPDVLVNAAAYTAVDKAESDADAAHLINGAAPGYLAAASAARAIPFLHISTDFVFDGTKAGAYSETDTCNPLSVYGLSKYEGEGAVQKANPQHIILRTAWVFGGAANFVKTMQRLAKDRDQINVVSDQFGGPTSAKDIAAALVDIARQVVAPDFEDWGIYHFTGQPRVSWFEFAAHILKDETNVTVSPIPTSDYPTPAKRPANSVLDCSKIEAVFGLQQPDWRNQV